MGRGLRPKPVPCSDLPSLEIDLFLTIGAAFWRCKRQVEREGTLQEPAQSETRIFGPRTNEGKVGRKNTLQKVPYPAMIKGRTT